MSSNARDQPEDLLLSYNHLKEINIVKSQLKKESIWSRIDHFLVCVWFCRLCLTAALLAELSGLCTYRGAEIRQHLKTKSQRGTSLNMVL
jgi:hypothetical protein